MKKKESEKAHSYYCKELKYYNVLLFCFGFKLEKRDERRASMKEKQLNVTSLI